MLNIKELENLRTKEELINYFKAMGQSITEEEIERLKKSYEQAEENNDYLSLDQLDNIAGGNVKLKRIETENRRKQFVLSDAHNFLNAVSSVFRVHNPIRERSATAIATAEREALAHYQHQESTVTRKEVSTTTMTTTTMSIDLTRVPVEQRPEENFTFYRTNPSGAKEEIIIEPSHIRALFVPENRASESPMHASKQQPSVDKHNPDVQVLINDYGKVIYGTLATTTETSRVELINEEIKRVEDMKVGTVPITKRDLVDMFNKVYQEVGGLAESLIHTTAEQFSKNDIPLNGYRLDAQNVNGHGYLHLTTTDNREKLFSLNSVDGKCILSTNAGKVNFLTSEAVHHITEILEGKDLGEQINFWGAEFTKLADDVFRFVNTDNVTFVSNSGGEVLLEVKEGKVISLEDEGAKFIVDQLQAIPIGWKVEIGGATFIKEAGGAFSFVDKYNDTVVMNSEGKILFEVEEGIVNLNGDYLENGAKFIVDLLKDREEITIAGAEFTKEAEGVFSFVDENNNTVVMNSEGNRLIRIEGKKAVFYCKEGVKFIVEQLKGKEKEKVTIAGAEFTKEAEGVFSFVDENNNTVVMNSEGEILFEVEEGIVNLNGDYLENGAKFIVDLLKDREEITIAGATFTKEVGDAFSYVNTENDTVVRNSKGEFLFRIIEGMSVEGGQNYAKFIADLLKYKAPGDTITIAGVEFRKEAEGVFSYIDIDNDTSVMDSKGNPLFWANEGKVGICYYDGAKFVVDLLKGNKPGDPIKIGNGTFTKLADDVFSYVDTDNDTVVMNSECKILILVREGKIIYNIEGKGSLNFILEVLKKVDCGEEMEIAGAKFKKEAKGVFSYVNTEDKTVVMNSEGKSWVNPDIIHLGDECLLGINKIDENKTIIINSKGEDLFTVKEGKAFAVTKEGAKFITKQIEGIELKETKEIAGAEVRKLAEGVFSYVNTENETVVMNSEGKEVCKLDQAIKFPEKIDNEVFTTIKGEQGELLVVNSKNEVLAYFSQCVKVGYFNIDWVNRKLRDLSKITSEERDMLNKILRGLFKPNITGKAINLLGRLGSGESLSIDEIANQIAHVNPVLHNVYIDDDGMFCANGHKFKKVEVRINNDGLRCLNFSDEIKIDDEIKELKLKVAELETKIRWKKQEIQKIQDLSAVRNSLIAELAQATTCEEENEIFEKIIASIIDIDPELAAPIKEKIEERRQKIEEARNKINEIRKLFTGDMTVGITEFLKYFDDENSPYQKKLKEDLQKIEREFNLKIKEKICDVLDVVSFVPGKRRRLY